MKLTWGERFWPSQSKSISSSPLNDDTTCEVLIVGAGISGALIADALVKAGLDVIAIDKRAPGCGSTGASTALLLYELDQPLHKLISLVGKTNAVRAYQLGGKAIERIGQLVEELGDPCGYEQKLSLYVTRHPKDVEALRTEFEVRRLAGFEVTFLSQAEIKERFGFSRPAGILSQLAAQVDPFCLNQRLLERANAGGLRLFAKTELKECLHSSDGLVASTISGHRIRARHLIYAKGYEAAGVIDPKLACAQISYAIVSDPGKAMDDHYEHPLIWEAAEKYLYLRTTSDGRDMIGGEDDPDLSHLNDLHRLDEKRRTLEHRFREFFPERDFSTAAAWAGIFETTPDGLPYIGSHPRFPGALFALGYGGNGITFSMIAAELLRDRITGKTNPDEIIFRLDR